MGTNNKVVSIIKGGPTGDLVDGWTGHHRYDIMAQPLPAEGGLVEGVAPPALRA